VDVGVVSLPPEAHRYFLTILLWALILEIIVVAFYVGRGELDRFELHLTLFTMAITVAGVAAIIYKIKKEVEEGL
jgi:hypothetical protein